MYFQRSNKIFHFYSRKNRCSFAWTCFCNVHNFVSIIQFEAQTSFGSIYKTRIEGTSMFCDFYNPQQKTYCKRLKVLCPEHTKEPRVSRKLCLGMFFSFTSLSGLFHLYETGKLHRPQENSPVTNTSRWGPCRAQLLHHHGNIYVWNLTPSNLYLYSEIEV